MADPADCLYVSPHVDDVFRSCAARLVADQARGLRSLIVGLFDGPADEDALARDATVDGLLGGVPPLRRRLGLPGAPARDASYTTFSSRASGWAPADESCLGTAAELLNDLGYRTRARDVYVPLGVGANVDHRLAHEAAMRSFRSGDGRNVFLYEERPEALVPGAVRMRLAQIGAWLPPGAAQSAEDAGLASFLMSFHVAPSVRGDLRSWSERLQSTGLATRQWRAARAWSPMKGLGPRLQPVVHATRAEVELDRARSLVGQVTPGRERSRLRLRLARLATGYAKRLGGEAHAERLWLLLPSRGEVGAAPPSPEALPA